MFKEKSQPFFRYGRIGRRLFLTLLLVALTPLVILGLRTYQSARRTVEHEVFLQMEAVAGYKKILIENWLAERLNDLTAALHSSLISTGDLSRGSPALFSYLGSEQFDAVVLITNDVIRLNPGASIEDSIWASTLPALLSNGSLTGKETTLYFKPEYDQRIGTWFTLLKAFPTPNGRFLIAAGKVRLAHSLDRLLSDSVGLGKTGQSYLIDSDGVMLTGSRFQHHPVAGTHKMSSSAITSALAGNSGVGVYNDWNGNPSLGAWRSITGPGWALIAEMDEAEAMTSVHQLRKEWLIAAFLTLILAGLAASLLSKTLGNPILELAAVSKSVASGNLKTQSKSYRKDELGDLARAFDQMIIALDASNAALKKSYADLLQKEKLLIQSEKLAAIGELVASIVHELRNPLSAVKMNLKILSKSVESDSVEGEQFSIANDQVGRMEKMLGSLLEFSKPVQPTISLFSLNELLLSIKDSFTFRSTQSNAKIELTCASENITFSGDYELLTQAFSNLLDNSLAAIVSPNGGLVSINLERSNDSPNLVSITFTDNGRGMTSSTLDRIFEPFFTTRPEGTGLGLPNVRKVIELHHGTISVASQPDTGTVVNILLPNGEHNA